MSYKSAKEKLQKETTAMEDEMLRRFEVGDTTLEKIAGMFGYKDRQSAWYHIHQAKKRKQ